MESGETDMNAIIDIAAKLTNKQRIRDIKKRMTTQLKSEKHSLSAVAELKAICDTSDKYLIYKIHDSNMTGQGSSYVFKSSRKMAQLALLTWINIKPFGAPLWKNQHILMACIGDVKAGKLSPCGSSTPQARDSTE